MSNISSLKLFHNLKRRGEGQEIKILLHKVCCNLTLLILIVQSGMTQSTTGHRVVVRAETREGRKRPFLWDSALLIKQWLSGEFLIHELWQLNFNWIPIFRIWRKISSYTIQQKGVMEVVIFLMFQDKGAKHHPLHSIPWGSSVEAELDQFWGNWTKLSAKCSISSAALQLCTAKD